MFANTDLGSVNIYNNEVCDQSTGLFIAFSAVDINNSIFNFTQFPIEYEYNWDAAYDYSLQGWFMSISFGSDVNIDNTSFKNGYGSNGGAIYVSGTATLTITDNNFNYGYVMSQGGVIYGFGFNKIVIINCTFNDNYSEGDSSDLYLDSGTAEMTRTNFYLLPRPSSIFVSTENFSATLLTFSNDYPELNEFYESTNGDAIFAENMEKWTIQSSNITNLNYSYFGGAIYFAVTMQKRKSMPSAHYI